MKDSEKIRHAISCVIAAAKDDPSNYETFCTLALLYEKYDLAAFAENKEKSEAENV